MLGRSEVKYCEGKGRVVQDLVLLCTLTLYKRILTTICEKAAAQPSVAADL